jgi:hypothetical protein
MSMVLSFPATEDQIVHQPLVSNDRILSYVVFGILIVLSLILIQLFVISRQLSNALSHRSLLNSLPITRRRTLFKRKGRRCSNFRYIIHSNKLTTGQSRLVTWAQSSATLGTCERASQCDNENLAPSRGMTSPFRICEQAVQSQMISNGMTSSPPPASQQVDQCASTVCSHDRLYVSEPMRDRANSTAFIDTDSQDDRDDTTPPTTSHVQVGQYDSVLLTDHSLSASHSFSTQTPPILSFDNKQCYPPALSTISVSDLESIGIYEDSRIGGLLAVRNDGSKVYTITNAMEPNRMTAALIIRSNGTIEIMTREGEILSLTDASTKSFSITSTTPFSALRSFSTITKSSFSYRSTNMITIPELESLGILDAHLGNYSIRKDGTKDFVIIKSNELIATLSVRPDQAIEVIKNGEVFALIDASGDPIRFSLSASFSRPRSRSSSCSESSSLHAYPQSPSPHTRRCFWCDHFGHELSTCRQLSEDMCLRKIYITHDNCIVDTLGHQFPLAIGRGGMRSFL